MPALNYRLEVRIASGTKARLEKLRKEAAEKSGKSVSMSALVAKILDSYLDLLPAQEVEDEKNI